MLFHSQNEGNKIYTIQFVIIVHNLYETTRLSLAVNKYIESFVNADQNYALASWEEADTCRLDGI